MIQITKKKFKQLFFQNYCKDKYITYNQLSHELNEINEICGPINFYVTKCSNLKQASGTVAKILYGYDNDFEIPFFEIQIRPAVANRIDFGTFRIKIPLSKELYFFTIVEGGRLCNQVIRHPHVYNKYAHSLLSVCLGEAGVVIYRSHKIYDIVSIVLSIQSIFKIKDIRDEFFFDAIIKSLYTCAICGDLPQKIIALSEEKIDGKSVRCQNCE